MVEDVAALGDQSVDAAESNHKIIYNIYRYFCYFYKHMIANTGKYIYKIVIYSTASIIFLNN
jgi:hypothetical protein